MTAEHVWKFLHIASLFLMMTGVGAVMAPVYSAWHEADLRRQMFAFTSAANNETALLLPGTLLTGVTGVFWAASAHHNFVKEGWLLTLSIIYVVTTLVFLPLLGLGLRRARVASLKSWKSGKLTPELQSALADNVPLVFGTIIILLLPVMGWLAVFKPF
ncbi:MAG: DUF2269 family protein [Dehalococcoidia bacterium]